jgi:hypothetical protein
MAKAISITTNAFNDRRCRTLPAAPFLASFNTSVSYDRED